jgi:hypothetical protein
MIRPSVTQHSAASQDHIDTQITAQTTTQTHPQAEDGRKGVN